MKLLVGLSLSFCIKDMIQHEWIEPTEVAFITAGTKFSSSYQFLEVLDHYKESYWRENPQKGVNLATWFYNEGLILQPRLEGRRPYSFKGEAVYKGWRLAGYWAPYVAGMKDVVPCEGS